MYILIKARIWISLLRNYDTPAILHIFCREMTEIKVDYFFNLCNEPRGKQGQHGNGPGILMLNDAKKTTMLIKMAVKDYNQLLVSCYFIRMYLSEGLTQCKSPFIQALDWPQLSETNTEHKLDFEIAPPPPFPGELWGHLRDYWLRLMHCIATENDFEWHPVQSIGYNAGLILGLRPANERRRYFKVTTSLISWVHAWSHPCKVG